MFLRKPTYHRFEYIPRFYNPDRDPAERLKRQMRARRHARRPKKGFYLLFALLFLILYLYFFFSGGLR